MGSPINSASQSTTASYGSHSGGEAPRATFPIGQSIAGPNRDNLQVKT